MRATNVRAEWLLCGAGPMFSAGMPEGLDTLALPVELRSAFSLLEAELSPAIPSPAPVAGSSHEPGRITPAAIAAAKAVAQARGALKPVYVLLGKDALYAGARPVVTALLTKKYVTGVGLTAAAADLDVPNTHTIDKTFVAKLGAQAGLGFGEALCRWAEPPNSSVVDVAQRMSAAITIHPEFGEVGGHFQTSLRGAELGAAIGAVAYVDGLIFADNVRNIAGEPPGVCIAIGEARRMSNLLLQALRASQQPDAPARRDFEFVLIDHATDLHVEHTIRCNGGQFHFIQGDLASGADGLAKACDAVFDGTI